MREIRLPNKTQWALQDTVSDCKDMRRDWDKAMSMAERNLDPAMMQVLGRLINYVGKIESRSIRAIHGEYEQEQ
jgi:hypothetical protein